MGTLEESESKFRIGAMEESESVRAAAALDYAVSLPGEDSLQSVVGTARGPCGAGDWGRPCPIPGGL